MLLCLALLLGKLRGALLLLLGEALLILLRGKLVGSLLGLLRSGVPLGERVLLLIALLCQTLLVGLRRGRDAQITLRAKLRSALLGESGGLLLRRALLGESGGLLLRHALLALLLSESGVPLLRECILLRECALLLRCAALSALRDAAGWAGSSEQTADYSAAQIARHVADPAA